MVKGMKKFTDRLEADNERLKARVAELETAMQDIFHPGNRGTSGRIIIDREQERELKKLLGVED